MRKEIKVLMLSEVTASNGRARNLGFFFFFVICCSRVSYFRYNRVISFAKILGGAVNLELSHTLLPTMPVSHALLSANVKFTPYPPSHGERKTFGAPPLEKD